MFPSTVMTFRSSQIASVLAADDLPDVKIGVVVSVRKRDFQNKVQNSLSQKKPENCGYTAKDGDIVKINYKVCGYFGK